MTMAEMIAAECRLAEIALRQAVLASSGGVPVTQAPATITRVCVPVVVTR